MAAAKLRMADLEKDERQRAEVQASVASGNLRCGDALAIFRSRLENAASLKPRTKEFRKERISALLNSWPGLEGIDVRKIGKQDCLTWAAGYAAKRRPQSVNTCASTLRMILEVPVEAGTLYDNPARFIKKLRVRQKALHLPDHDPFLRMLKLIEHVNLRHLFATRCIESGVDIPTVLRWLGHKDGGALAMKV